MPTGRPQCSSPASEDQNPLPPSASPQAPQLPLGAAPIADSSLRLIWSPQGSERIAAVPSRPLPLPTTMRLPWFLPQSPASWGLLSLRIQAEDLKGRSGSGSSRCFHPVVVISPTSRYRSGSRSRSRLAGEEGGEQIWANLTHFGLGACRGQTDFSYRTTSAATVPDTQISGYTSGECEALLLLDPSCSYRIALVPDLSLVFPQVCVVGCMDQCVEEVSSPPSPPQSSSPHTFQPPPLPFDSCSSTP